jgi:hypothetical protein
MIRRGVTFIHGEKSTNKKREGQAQSEETK